MLDRSASLAMSTSVLKALPGKLDSRKHSLVFSMYFLTIVDIGPVVLFDDSSRTGLLLWIFFVTYVSGLSLICVLFFFSCGLVVTCSDRVDLLDLLCFCHFTVWYPGQVWYLIASIPDLCLPLCYAS